MNTDQQLRPAEGGHGEEVEVIVLDDRQYREVFDTTLEVEMENVSLNDHDYTKGERPREVRWGSEAENLSEYIKIQFHDVISHSINDDIQSNIVRIK